MSVIKDRKTIIRETKQQFIVNVTNDLFSEIGIDNTSMDDIAMKANYTKRTLYAYFKSKDEIFLWAFTDDIFKRWEYQKVEILKAGNGLDKLRAWAFSLYEYSVKNPHSMQMQNFMDYNSINKEKVAPDIFQRFESFNLMMANVLRDALKLGVEDGSIREDIEIDITISQFAYAFRAVLYRTFSSAYSFTKIDQATYINHYLEMTMRSIRKV